MFKKILDILKKEWYDYSMIRRERREKREKKDLYKKLFSNMIEKY